MEPSDSQPKRRKPRKISPIDRMVQRERGQMELQMRRTAVLQYVGEQLAELNELLRDAGFAPRQFISQPFPQIAVPPGLPGPSPQIIARPCVWCGQPGNPVNLGAGLIQDLCRIHAGAQRGEARGPNGEFEQAAAQGFSVNHTDARPAPRASANVGKIVMQPTPQDAGAAQQATQEAANGAATPEGFEEISDE